MSSSAWLRMFIQVGKKGEEDFWGKHSLYVSAKRQVAEVKASRHHVLETVLSSFQGSCCSCFHLQVMRLKHREVRQLGHGHTVCKW